MLSPVRIEIEGGGVGNISSRVIRHHGDIIAYLVLLRPSFERSKRTAHCHVRRPGNSAVGAVRIEQLRIGVVCGISCVQPNRIDSSIGRDTDRTKIVPLIMINWVVVDPVRRAKSNTSVCAAHEHHVRAIIGTEWLHAGHHVNVIVSWSPRSVDCQECLPCQSVWINCAAEDNATPHVNCGNLVESWCDSRVLSVSRTDAPETATLIITANKQVAIGSHIQCSPIRVIRDVNWTLPRGAAIGGAAEFSEVASEKAGPKLILKPVSHTAGRFIYSEPFLVSAVCAALRRTERPRLSTVRRAPDVATESVHQQAEIEEISGVVRIQYRITAEDIVLQNTGKSPVKPTVGRIAITCLAEVGSVGIKLPPTYGDLVTIRRIDCNRRLVRGVTYDVVATRVDIYLIANKDTVRRDHSWRGVQSVGPQRRRRHSVFFQRLRHPAADAQWRLSGTADCRYQRDTNQQEQAKNHRRFHMKLNGFDTNTAIHRRSYGRGGGVGRGLGVA